MSLTEDAFRAFEALKQACMTAPILAFADYTKPFLLETDASKDGLGAVLLQKQADGWYCPVAYGSRALIPREKNYHSTKLKFLALKWAVHDSAVVEGDHCLEQEVRVIAGQALVQMHVTDWAEAQKEDPMLHIILDWLKAQKKTDLKALLAEHASSEEGRLILKELAEFYNLSRSFVPALNAQR